ncbi:MAG: hypothetical protein ACFCU2_01850 [Acidimicrobiia bacterium]
MELIEWLLESDPAIRWQVMGHLTGQPVDTVDAERTRVANEGWGARLIALQERRTLGRRHLSTGLGRRVQAILRRLDGHALLASTPA